MIIALVLISAIAIGLIITHWKKKENTLNLELNSVKRTLEAKSDENQNLLLKYGEIIDIDAHAIAAKEESANLKKEMASLKEKYALGQTRLNDLIKHINTLEENSETLDFGLYTPRYDFDLPEKYKDALQANYNKQKWMIQDDRAASCPTDWTVNGSKVEGRKMTRQTMKVMLRAFNGECDACVAKVRWDNINKMEERITKSFQAINKSGEVNNIKINREYLELKLEEIRITFEYTEKLKEEKEEQKRIQEEMREEEKVRRELEKAKIEAEKEEDRYSKALEKAKAELERSTGEKTQQLEERISELNRLLEDSKNAKDRAISQAQLTKSGHVYVISNIGSFGHGVYKIGMTRRLEPTDRVKELGDASVPFSFDVHAMMYSENAPQLELMLHREFATRSVNLVNMKKEFFNVELSEIESWLQSQGINYELTKLAEASEFRKTQSIRSKGAEKEAVAKSDFEHISPDELFENV